ncbi:mucin-13-like isoform X3 [Alosa sapidissima]|uniref:mucin-13-like isoform X3 n=1 Tax=Alosa sapidissima TaxID=34773 RepID=UPI001C09C32B|nr:mucin-13-like isoform X3 [Alosa sapidissima]
MGTTRFILLALLLCSSLCLAQVYTNPNKTTVPPGPDPDKTTTAAPPGPDPDKTTTAAPPGPDPDKTTTVKPPGPDPDKTTTAAPPGPDPDKTTTAVPPGPDPDKTTTAAPPGPDPDKTTTMKPPGPDPDKTTTAVPPGPDPDKTTTAAPPGPDPDKTTTAVPIPTKPKGPCNSNPCPPSSKCEELLDEYRCLCEAGLIYNKEENVCKQAKVFAGDLTVSGTYDQEMADKTSKAFKNTSDAIVNNLKNAFTDPDLKYDSSVVISLKPASTTVKVLYRTTRTGITAEVTNVFQMDSAVDEAKVKAAAATVGTFTVTKLCAKNPCNAETALKCNDEGGVVNCTCRKGFAWTKDNNYITCAVCSSGKKADAGKCINCPTGYSGINCKDNYLLIVIVVSSVLGVLLVVSMLVTTYAFLGKPKGKKGKKDKSKANDMAMTFPNLATDTKPNFTVPRVGGGTEMTKDYTRPNSNMGRTTNMNGYHANASTGMESNSGAMSGYRAQTGQSLDRAASMSGYRANTPTNMGMSGGGMGGGGMSGYRANIPTNAGMGGGGMGGGGMSGYRANTPTNAGMGGGGMGGGGMMGGVQANQNRANNWRNPTYEEPNNSNYGIPRVGQANQPRNNPYSPY